MTTAQLLARTAAVMSDNLVRFVMTSSRDFSAELIAEIHRFIHEAYLLEEDLHEEIQLR